MNKDRKYNNILTEITFDLDEVYVGNTFDFLL